MPDLSSRRNSVLGRVSLKRHSKSQNKENEGNEDRAYQLVTQDDKESEQTMAV
jgi:hypothetical protein